MSATKVPAGLRAVLWLLLVAWLVVLGNYRAGNPLGRSQAPEMAEDFISDILPPAPAKPVRVSAAPNRPAGSSSRPAGSSSRPAGADLQSAPPRAETWGPQLAASLKAGDFAEAAAIAKRAGSSLGDEIAALLGNLTTVDDAVVAEIMNHHGTTISIVFNGMERSVIPMSSLGTQVEVEFSGRTVTIDIAKFANEEKIRWLEQADTDESRMLALSLALQVDDRDAAARIISATQTLRQLFNQ